VGLYQVAKVSGHLYGCWGVDCNCLYNSSIWLWNCSNSVVFFILFYGSFD